MSAFRAGAVWLSSFVLLACTEKTPPSPAPVASTSVAPASSASRLAVSAPAPIRDASPAPKPVSASSWDAGRSACTSLRGTTEPRGKTRPGTTAETASHVFALRPDGMLEARAKTDSAVAMVGRARPGTRIAAAQFGAHDAVVFLAEQKTSEGTMLAAFASIDRKPAVRISDDGAGATSVDVAPRGSAAIVAYLDARGAMAPLHARVLRDKDGSVDVGKDTVVFVGGAPDPNVAGVLATSADLAYYALPIARDTTSFGMALVKIDDVPREDAEVTWSPYPNGLDPAPIAATRGQSPIHVARVVPRSNGPGGPRGIELGVVTAGAFRSLGLVADEVAVSFVALDAEPSGKNVTLRFVDGDTWVTSTLACPP